MSPASLWLNVPVSFRRYESKPLAPGGIEVIGYAQTTPRRCDWLRALLTPRHHLPRRIGPRGARKLRGGR